MPFACKQLWRWVAMLQVARECAATASARVVCSSRHSSLRHPINPHLRPARSTNMLAATSAITVDQIRATPDPASRRTKMVFTLGPSCWSVEGLVALIDAGMGVARFNFSHGTHEGHKATLDRLREATAQRPNQLVAVCLGKCHSIAIACSLLTRCRHQGS